MVLMYNTRLCYFLGKLKFRWYGPFTVVCIFSLGDINMEHNGESPFNVNGQRMNQYFGNLDEVKICDNMDLDEV